MITSLILLRTGILMLTLTLKRVVLSETIVPRRPSIQVHARIETGILGQRRSRRSEDRNIEALKRWCLSKKVLLVVALPDHAQTSLRTLIPRTLIPRIGSSVHNVVSKSTVTWVTSLGLTNSRRCIIANVPLFLKNLQGNMSLTSPQTATLVARTIVLRLMWAVLRTSRTTLSCLASITCKPETVLSVCATINLASV